MVAPDVELGADVCIPHPELVNLYGCSIGDGSKVGPFVEIQRGARVGRNCKISSHSFICEGVVIEDGVFVGHGVMFINDRYPRAVTENGGIKTETDWDLVRTQVRRGASIGSNATILCGVVLGENSMVGAGAVVTKSVPDYAIAAGSPARIIGDVRERETPAQS